ncbi:choice-of-anchor A family protein [Vibrio alfacsensis]|uniref:Choice-of-anchor A family protein n=1 Tax=Vibrio alfacsensis TaxID=1074311 RepID=A0ABN5PI19_9VIBR|nr:choice-of-anchor A family protein [Vibrio alfacsensis]AXY02853.1 choice-of-anchor A family protein [Vibrio alfacsensis]
MNKLISTSLVLFSAHASAIPTQYSALVFDNFNSPHSASMGALAVGNDASLNGYSIMYDNMDFPSNSYSLIVGGDLAFKNGRIYQGSVAVKGDISKVSESIYLGLASGSNIENMANLPINFDKLQKSSLESSSKLSQLENIGAVKYQWGGLYLDGDCQSDVQVFNLDGYVLEKAHTLALNCVPDGATVVVNISGDKPNFKPLSNISLADFTPHRQQTIFNLYEATSLTISGVELEGMVLAPKADINAPSGSSNVGIIANSWKGSMYLANHPFNGQLPVKKEPEPINAELKWHWQGSDFMPEYDQVMMTPITGQLNDDNGDGEIDNKDTADVIFVSFKENQYSNPGVLRAINGSDGSDLWNYHSGAVFADPRFSPATADMDNDGIVEIIVGNKVDRSAYIVDTSGVIKDRIKYAGFRNISIADVNNDSNPEILFSDGVYSYNNGYLYKFESWGPDPIALDYNLDGDLEVFANATLYNQFGDVLWSDTKHDYFWFSAVANLDDDAEPEFITSIPGKDATSHQLLAVYEHDGTLKWQVEDLSKLGGGVQSVSNFLSGSQLGIVSASVDNVRMFDAAGNVVWSYSIDDPSSYKVGVSAYDFDGDGRDEAIVQDQFKVVILDGNTGRERLSIPNSSGTLYEYPIIVDLEGDDNAELIVVSNNYDARLGTNSGVRAFKSKDSMWKNATRIWNQHSYHQTNISQDGKVPVVEKPSWLLNNSYRSSTLR